MKAKAPFTTFDFFFFRTPLLPLKEFLDWSEGTEAARVLGPATDHSTSLTSDDDDVRLTQSLKNDRHHLRERLKTILSRPEVRDALFVAAPNVIDRLHLWIEDPDSERGRKVEHVLVRYFSRMTGRATPFGLFAGISTGVIGDQTNLVDLWPRTLSTAFAARHGLSLRARGRYYARSDAEKQSQVLP